MLPLLLGIAQQTIALDRILDSPSLKGSVVGVYVSDVEGRTLYAREPDVRLVPASNQKVFTALYALSRIPLEERSTTRFWRIEDRVYVDAPGDPTLTRAQLTGVHEALGKPALPVAVRQAYLPGIGPDWEFDDLPFGYAAPTFAFGFDRGAFEFVVDGGEVKVPFEQRLSVIVDGGPGRFVAAYQPTARTLRLSGALPRGRRGFGRYAMAEPDAAAARLLGGEIERTDAPPPDRPADSELTGPSLAERLRPVLVDSDNVLAEHLLMVAALKEGPLPADAYPVAAGRMRSFFVDTVRLDRTGFLPRDGSGLSRQNLVTARALAEALRWGLRQPFADVFRASLPKPGEGTLRQRLQSSQFAGKTGTLNAVTSLSGYLTASDGRTVVVSLIVNHSATPASEVRPVIDRFVRRLEQAPPQ